MLKSGIFLVASKEDVIKTIVVTSVLIVIFGELMYQKGKIDAELEK